MLFDFLQDIGNYEQRKIERTICKNGIIVSTADTTDEGYETALIDKNGVHPVQRYETMQDAVEGHSTWVEFARDGHGKTITELAWTGMPTKEVVLEGNI